MLKVSEHFYSIQGEGASVGIPAYFIRLAGCNLMCGGSTGILVRQGRATWWCDSEAVWRKSADMDNAHLVKEFESAGVLDGILKGTTHLVWTGGEPTKPEHQKSIMEFLDFLNKSFPENLVFNEIETNGTIVTENDFYSYYIDQINCSPKLANSGMPENLRVVPDAIKQIRNHHEGYFKFVISTEDDIREIQDTYIKPFGISDQKVIIMPGVDNRNDLPERTRFLFEMTKKYGYRGITRQHILAWDKVTGV